MKPDRALEEAAERARKIACWNRVALSCVVASIAAATTLAGGCAALDHPMRVAGITVAAPDFVLAILALAWLSVACFCRHCVRILEQEARPKPREIDGVLGSDAST